MTKQSDALGADVNQIVKRFVAFGDLPNDGKTPTYGDFSNVDDYLTSLNSLKLAQDQFDDLPAAVRNHVGNDPGAFLEMIYDPTRRPELEELGLVEAMLPEELQTPPEPVITPPEVPPTPAVPAASTE